MWLAFFSAKGIPPAPSYLFQMRFSRDTLHRIVWKWLIKEQVWEEAPKQGEFHTVPSRGYIQPDPAGAPALEKELPGLLAPVAKGILQRRPLGSAH
jgi:hypothetical protein